ncbi:LysE family translocator [Jiella mangrovi]|uniref:LysE family translocator n=1 Tax=Jiella mangrovi TaxID=2821407 RepID=A0ABS4BI56_9HYPH|nr:LysE family translocator [Jiella mangrovi]MBP0616442.1 LysE family translocator [Jiella mangrovi]
MTPYLAYVVALSIVVVIRGPGIAGLVGQSLGNGLKVSLFFMAGIVAGDVTYLTVATAGLAALAEVFARALLVAKVLGGAYLVYLGILFWTNRGGIEIHQKANSHGGPKALLSGFMVTLGNPKPIVFYLALLPSVIDLHRVGFSQWSILAVLTILVHSTILTPYALVAAKARSVMTRPTAVRRLNRVAGGIIGGAGALMLWEVAVTAWRRV